jgi:hypothetical protein
MSRRSKRTSIHSYNDRTIFKTYWEHILIGTQKLVSINRMQVLSFRVDPVLPGLFSHMFENYPEVVERNVLKRVFDRAHLIASARDFDVEGFHAEKYLRQGAFGVIDFIKIYETKDGKGWTVSLQFSMISRTHCEIQNCPCADFVAESDEEVYVCRCGHRSGDHHLEKITFGIRAIY